jgi:hypothetical protein
MASITPDFGFVREFTFFIEKDNGFPFDFLIKDAITKYVEDHNTASVVDCKTILYPTRAHFEAFMTLRALNNHSTFDDPKISHFCSDGFCWEAFLEIKDE